MKRLLMFGFFIFTAVSVRALTPTSAGGGGTDGQVVSSATVNTLNVSTLTVRGTGVSNATVGQNAAAHTATLDIQAGASGNAILKLSANGGGVAQFYSGASGGAVLRTDTNAPLYLGTNQTLQAVLDTSGRLIMGNISATGVAPINISSGTGGTGSAMFSVAGSTATGSNALASIATTTPCGSNSVIGILVYIAKYDGTSSTPYYLLACPK